MESKLAEWMEEMIVQYAAHLACHVADNEDIAEQIRQQPRTALLFARIALDAEFNAEKKVNDAWWDEKKEK